jgi:hypothetical protein
MNILIKVFKKFNFQKQKKEKKFLLIEINIIIKKPFYKTIKKW